MNNILFPLRSILQLNTKLWLNCLEHVSDNIAWKRPSPDTNSLGFIALHLVDARYYLAAYAGLDIQNPYKEALAHVRSIEDLREQERPTVEQLRRDWRAVSDVVEQGLAALKAEDLHADSPQPFPIDDGSKYGGLMFLLHHESYHIGQMALLRKYAGLAAMKYT